MIVLNLFIGVIMTSMDEARLEADLLDAERKGEPPAVDRYAELVIQLDEMSKTIEALRSEAAKTA